MKHLHEKRNHRINKNLTYLGHGRYKQMQTVASSKGHGGNIWKWVSSNKQSKGKKHSKSFACSTIDVLLNKLIIFFSCKLYDQHTEVSCWSVVVNCETILICMLVHNSVQGDTLSMVTDCSIIEYSEYIWQSGLKTW